MVIVRLLEGVETDDLEVSELIIDIRAMIDDVTVIESVAVIEGNDITVCESWQFTVLFPILIINGDTVRCSGELVLVCPVYGFVIEKSSPALQVRIQLSFPIRVPKMVPLLIIES